MHAMGTPARAIALYLPNSGTSLFAVVSEVEVEGGAEGSGGAAGTVPKKAPIESPLSPSSIIFCRIAIAGTRARSIALYFCRFVGTGADLHSVAAFPDVAFGPTGVAAAIVISGAGVDAGREGDAR